MPPEICPLSRCRGTRGAPEGAPGGRHRRAARRGGKPPALTGGTLGRGTERRRGVGSTPAAVRPRQRGRAAGRGTARARHRREARQRGGVPGSPRPHGRGTEGRRRGSPPRPYGHGSRARHWWAGHTGADYVPSESQNGMVTIEQRWVRRTEAAAVEESAAK